MLFCHENNDMSNKTHFIECASEIKGQHVFNLQDLLTAWNHYFNIVSNGYLEFDCFKKTTFQRKGYSIKNVIQEQVDSVTLTSFHMCTNKASAK